MKGYFRDAAETDKAIVDGWFHTGDAAVVHSDGYVEIRDRFKDVIISGGENISSVEVEHPAAHNRSGHQKKLRFASTRPSRQHGSQDRFWLEELAAPYYVFEDAGAPLSPKSPINGTR